MVRKSGVGDEEESWCGNLDEDYPVIPTMIGSSQQGEKEGGEEERRGGNKNDNTGVVVAKNMK